MAKTASGRFQCAEFRVDEVGQAEFNSILKVARRQVATTVKMGQQSAVVETLARDGRLVSDYRLKFATKSAVTEPFEKYFRERLRRRVEARMVSQWKVGDLCWMRFKDDVEYPGEIVESNSLTQVMVVYFMEDNTTEWNVATDCTDLRLRSSDEKNWSGLTPNVDQPVRVTLSRVVYDGIIVDPANIQNSTGSAWTVQFEQKSTAATDGVTLGQTEVVVYFTEDRTYYRIDCKKHKNEIRVADTNPEKSAQAVTPRGKMETSPPE